MSNEPFRTDLINKLMIRTIVKDTDGFAKIKRYIIFLILYVLKIQIIVPFFF